MSCNFPADGIHLFVQSKQRDARFGIQLEPLRFGVFLNLQVFFSFFEYGVYVFPFREYGIYFTENFDIKWINHGVNVVRPIHKSNDLFGFLLRQNCLINLFFLLLLYMSLLHQIALTKIKGVGPVVARNLLSYCGSAEAVFSTSKKQLSAIPQVGEYIAKSISSTHALTEAETEIQFIEKHHINVLFWGEQTYPKRLKNCFDAPLLLYYKGNANLNSSRIISIVGTRNATSYGKSICEEFTKALKPYDVMVVSGLAYGIDSHAHKNALKHDIPTVGVLGHGLDRIYPAANRELAAKMLDCGGLLTEFSSGTNPDRQNFPMRNRIIAGLADITVVVEAAFKGGALITAEIANNYNRDVCAFPGSVYREFSAGCNYLIKTNRAHLIGGAKDLEYLMNWSIEEKKTEAKQLELHVSLDSTEQTVYDIVQASDKTGIDDLAIKLDWPQSKLAITLLQMEMKGVIIALPGKIYRTV